MELPIGSGSSASGSSAARPIAGLLAALAALLLSLPAVAGSIAFGLSITGPQLVLVNQGDASAFYPAVFRLLRDGRWGRLGPASPQAELAPGASLRTAWPVTAEVDEGAGPERLLPVMVRFFDQAGVGYGQITFFRPPPPVVAGLKVRYAHARLQIETPDAASPIRASWVLWSQEEGIDPIRMPVRFEHDPPPAIRVDWRGQWKPMVEFATARGQPAVVLLHETERGYTVQNVRGGARQGREQRAAWLDASAAFYAASLLFLAIALGATLVLFLRRPSLRAGS